MPMPNRLTRFFCLFTSRMKAGPLHGGRYNGSDWRKSGQQCHLLVRTATHGINDATMRG
jgi:hypothetical protein